MKKIFKTDKFVDYKGVERPFTVCVLYDKTSDMHITTKGNVYTNYKGNFDIYGVTAVDTDVPAISIGLSIVHATDVDKVKPGLGEKIAEGRALKAATDVITSTNHRLLLSMDLEEIADKYIKVMKNNPGVFINGYDQMKERYLKQLSKKLGSSKQLRATVEHTC